MCISHTNPGCTINTSPGLYTGQVKVSPTSHHFNRVGGAEVAEPSVRQTVRSAFTASFSKQMVQLTLAGGSGCSIVSSSQSSFGMPFNEAGGGVFAMLWNQDGIRMCELLS